MTLGKILLYFKEILITLLDISKQILEMRNMLSHTLIFFIAKLILMGRLTLYINFGFYNL